MVPPRRCQAKGCGTVTGAPEDVANALAELRKHLCADKQPPAPETHPAAARDARRDEKAGRSKAAGKGAPSRRGPGGSKYRRR